MSRSAADSFALTCLILSASRSSRFSASLVAAWGERERKKGGLEIGFFSEGSKTTTYYLNFLEDFLLDPPVGQGGRLNLTDVDWVLGKLGAFGTLGGRQKRK